MNYNEFDPIPKVSRIVRIIIFVFVGIFSWLLILGSFYLVKNILKMIGFYL